MTSCLVCGGPLRAGLAPWHHACPACGFERSDLAPRLDDELAHAALDEARREVALHALREANFTRILARLEPLLGARRRLLEIGCAHGWFLAQCVARGIEAEGLEPDARLAETSEKRGLRVRRGLFPGALDPGERWNVLAFHDVFEHLPDPDGALEACRRHLAPGGLLVLNLPSADGFLYRTAKLLARQGRPASFERMWQKGLPSPHQSYFSPSTLRVFCARRGFEEVVCATLPSVVWSGLWQRIRFAGSASAAADALTWSALALAAPLLRVLPADITLQIFRAPGGAGEA